ncbi:unnamed protein product, partial [Protopolystoma xenopodis]
MHQNLHVFMPQIRMKSKPIQNLSIRNKLQLTPALLRRRVGNRNE